MNSLRSSLLDASACLLPIISRSTIGNKKYPRAVVLDAIGAVTILAFAQQIQCPHNSLPHWRYTTCFQHFGEKSVDCRELGTNVDGRKVTTANSTRFAAIASAYKSSLNDCKASFSIWIGAPFIDPDVSNRSMQGHRCSGFSANSASANGCCSKSLILSLYPFP